MTNASVAREKKRPLNVHGSEGRKIRRGMLALQGSGVDLPLVDTLLGPEPGFRAIGAPPRSTLESTEGDMAGDDLDLSEFEEFSSTAKERAGRTSSDPGRGAKKGGKRASRPRRWPWFLTGLVLGGVIALLGPDLAAPYLPPILQPGGEEVRGPVVGKRVGNDRVLLTVDTERGALLATFRQRVPEIDLLVEEGDTVTLVIPEYAPLIEDPVLSAVRKGSGGGGERSGRSAEDASPSEVETRRETPADVEGEADDQDGVSPSEDASGSGEEAPASATGDSSSSGN